MRRLIDEEHGGDEPAEFNPYWRKLIRIPHVSQYSPSVRDPGAKACYRACQEMARAAGFRFPDSTLVRLQIAIGENGNGEVIPNPSGLAKALQFAHDQLMAGIPVIAGLSYKDANYNRDGITDHFVLLVGMDMVGGGRFLAQDPGRMSMLSDASLPNLHLSGDRWNDWNFQSTMKSGTKAQMSMIVLGYKA
jgi:hypothetical protein